MPTVLVVEDEAIIRMMAVGLVEDLGFVPLEAANADEAMMLIEQNDDITILFTDINMPGSMDGLQLAAVARARRPSLGLVIVSGKHKLGADEIPRGAKFFTKPYEGSTVQRALLNMSNDAA